MEDKFLRNIISQITEGSEKGFVDKAELIKSEWRNKQMQELLQVFFEVYWQAPEKLSQFKEIIDESSPGVNSGFQNYLKDYSKFFPDIPLDPPVKENYKVDESFEDFEDDSLKYFSGHPVYLPNGDFALEERSSIRYFRKVEDGFDELKNAEYKYSSARRPLEYRYFDENYYLVINAQSLAMVKYSQSENERLRKVLQGEDDDYPTKKLEDFCDARVCPDGRIMVLGFDRVDYLTFNPNEKSLEVVESYPLEREKILEGKILPGNRIIFTRITEQGRLFLSKLNIGDGKVQTDSEEVTNLDETLMAENKESRVDFKRICANGNRILLTTKNLDRMASSLGLEGAAIYKKENGQWRLERKRKGISSAQLYDKGRLLSHTNVFLGANEFALENLDDGSKELLPLGSGKPKFAMGHDGRILCINGGQISVYDGDKK